VWLSDKQAWADWLFDRCESQVDKKVTRRVSCSSVKDDMENNAQRFGKNSISSTWMVGAACHEEVQATSGSVLAERDVPGQKE
jgi:hypothetical protein